MNNNLSFLPIELQNIIISYTRPVYPFIKQLKENEEEKQKEIDRKIKMFKKFNNNQIELFGYQYNYNSHTDLSFNMYIKNREYFENIYNERYQLTGDTDQFIWSSQIANSGGSINYFKKLKRKKRGKEIENKFKFMIDYYNKHKTSEDYEWNPDGEDKGTYIELGLRHTKRYYEYFDYIIDIKRTFRLLKNYDNLTDCVNRINRLNLFRSKREMWRNLNMRCNLKLSGVEYRTAFRIELEKRFKC